MFTKAVKIIFALFLISLGLEILTSDIDWLIVFVLNGPTINSLKLLPIIGITLSGFLCFLLHLPIKEIKFQTLAIPMNLAIFRLVWQGSYISASSITSISELIVNIISTILFLYCLNLVLATKAKASFSVSFSYLIRNISIWLFLFLPIQIIIFIFTMGLRLEQATNGYVFLKPDGMYSAERIFKHKSKELQLTGMVHIAAPNFYHSFEKSISGKNTLLLLEGVTDEKKLIKTPPDYGAISKSLGLDNQKKDFNIGSNSAEIKKIRADMDVSSFHPETIEIINMIGKVKQKNHFNFKKFLELNLKTSNPNVSYKLFNDILAKRNQNLIQNIEQNINKYQKIIIPWGAFHLPEIEQWAQDKGFKFEKQINRQVFSFKSVIMSFLL